jgi:hypothetical protein
VQVVRSYPLVMPSIKMFREIIGKIFLPWVPCHVKILDFNLIGDPKEIFLHGAGSLLFHYVIGYGHRRGVVAVYRCWRLFMS